MSTDHQRYSIPNQVAAIAEFACLNGLDVIDSYADEGKSGLDLKGRAGLQRLLAAVMAPGREFSTVLVLDVSRWGRFQDPDEAAHYEFICREAGVRVVYCAEAFQDLDPVSGSIMKVLKRVMAAEYSRDLSAKITRGKLQTARLGLWTGSSAPYGLRRALIDPEGRVTKSMEDGERKPLKYYRSRIVEGPASEIATVRRVFDLYARSELQPRAIAALLNSEGIPGRTGRPWSDQAIRTMLQNELYIGVQLFNRSSQRLRGRVEPNPPEHWVRAMVMDPIVPPSLFSAAARRSRARRYRLRKRDLLDALRSVQSRHGHICYETIVSTPGTPAPSTFVRRFGSLEAACRLIGVEQELRGVRPRFNRQDLLVGLKSLLDRQGYLTAATIDAEPTLSSTVTIASYFGSLPLAYMELGIDCSGSALRSAAYHRARARGLPAPRRKTSAALSASRDPAD